MSFRTALTDHDGLCTPISEKLMVRKIIRICWWTSKALKSHEGFRTFSLHHWFWNTDGSEHDSLHCVFWQLRWKSSSKSYNQRGAIFEIESLLTVRVHISPCQRGLNEGSSRPCGNMEYWRGILLLYWFRNTGRSAHTNYAAILLDLDNWNVQPAPTHAIFAANILRYRTSSGRPGPHQSAVSVFEIDFGSITESVEQCCKGEKKGAL
jgi:hypothetical protein